MIRRYPLPPYLQRFFTDRLVGQLRASPNTVAGYRDTFRMLLRFVQEKTGKPPTDLHIDDLDADLIGRFLMFLEESRGNRIRSRNTRLAAIRSFFKYVAANEPQLIYHCQRILSMPQKRYDKKTIDFLSYDEADALVNAPDHSTWFGRRDRAILLLMIQTGLRVSEVITLQCGDIELGAGASVRCVGKGRKERVTPLRRDTVHQLRSWLSERSGNPSDPAFISVQGRALSRDAIERLVQKHVTAAAASCSTITKKHVSPHVLRHTAAMHLLQNGVDRTVIALWLGHESVETTQMYVHADIEMKEKAMAKTRKVKGKRQKGRFVANDRLLEFLEGL